MLTTLLNGIKNNFDQHLASTAGTVTSLFATGLNISGIVQGVIVGLVLYIITSGLKKLSPKLFK